jgi:hypothetical protein
MSDTPKIRRYAGADQMRLTAWLVPLIREHWGQMYSVGTVNNQIRAWQNSNDHNFVCTDNAVGLAQVARDPQDPVPVIEEVFLFCRAGHETEGVAIYKHWVTWGKTIQRASEFRFNRGIRSPMALLKEAFPNMLNRHVFYVSLED